ncbi:MAG: acylphosphatase [Geitlerinemataceae cyanobacterium]
MTDEQCCVRLEIYGRVQGVGFRYATKAEAQRLRVCGWVRNQRDGSVEACFAGDRDRVDALVQWCRRGPELAQVDDVILRPVESCDTILSTDGFEIRTLA